MQNTRTNELMVGEMDALRGAIPPEDRGPTFTVGDVHRIKGYHYKIVELGPNRLVFAPHGLQRDGGKPEKDDYKSRRRGQPSTGPQPG